MSVRKPEILSNLEPWCDMMMAKCEQRLENRKELHNAVNDRIQGTVQNSELLLKFFYVWEKSERLRVSKFIIDLGDATPSSHCYPCTNSLREYLGQPAFPICSVEISGEETTRCIFRFLPHIVNQTGLLNQSTIHRMNMREYACDVHN